MVLIVGPQRIEGGMQRSSFHPDFTNNSINIRLYFKIFYLFIQMSDLLIPDFNLSKTKILYFNILSSDI